MNLRVKIAAAAAVLLLAGCRQLPRYFAGEATLARVDGRELQLRDVKSVVPEGVTGDDSVAFMKLYVERWVLKQLKLQEAEELFSEAEDDIDRLVEEYRQALLIRKLDQHYVDRAVDTVFTDDEITAYYESHKADFRTDRTLVKGRIVCANNKRQALKLEQLMNSTSETAEREFGDICLKYDYPVMDMRQQWVEFSEFLSNLPTLRSRNYDWVLDKSGVHQMEADRLFYLFKIDEVRREGSEIPLEMLRGTIRRILFNQRQGELIRAYEEQLYKRARDEEKIKIFIEDPAPEQTSGEETTETTKK